MKRTKFKQKKKRISVSSAKSKGRELQKWTCEQISEVTGFEWGKDKPIESRPMGQSGVDVRMEKQVLESFPYSIECKRQEKWSVPSWIKQAKENEITGTSWLNIARSNRQEPVAIIDAVRFFEILRHDKRDKVSKA